MEPPAPIPVTTQPSAPDIHFVPTVDAYLAIRDLLRQPAFLAVDFESTIKEFELVLVSIAILGDARVFVIDAHAAGMRGHLKALLERRRVITHGAAERNCQDQRALKKYGIDPTLVLFVHDTQDKHKALTGDGRLIGLAELLERHLIPMRPGDVERKEYFKAMMKNKASPDWRNKLTDRPLDPRVMAYAASDVRYLIQLAIAQGFGP